MQLFNIDKIENTEIEIYFKYRHLDTGEIAELFERLNRFYKNLLESSYPVYYSEKYNAPFRNFLKIESINTGQSIRIIFKEGWKPEFKLRNQDLEIIIPKKLGIPVFLIYFLLAGTQKSIGIYNDKLDGQLKELEIKLKQMELYEKIIEREQFRRPNYTKSYQRQAEDTMQLLIKNHNINYIEINGITIKDEE